jgi:AsmA protein
MRAFKIIGIILGSLAGLLVLAGVAIWLLFDPNDYKDRISAAVQRSTGRTLSLPGELKLSLFPWVAIETGEASLGNPPGFGEEPFLSLKRARLSVKLMPLLRKQLEIGRIEIDGLDLRLKQDAQGKGNWEEWGGDDTAEPEVDESTGGPTSFDLAGIAITDSRIAFQDLVAEDVEVDIGRVASGVPVKVSMSTRLVTAPGEKPLPLSADFALVPDLDAQRYQFANLVLKGRLQPEGVPSELDWRFETPAADLDLAQQTLAATDFTAAFGAAKLVGRIEGTKLIDSPALSGIFRLEEVSPRTLMRQLGIEQPETRDETVLTRLAAQGAYAWQGGVMRLTNLAFTLDDSKLAGRFSYDTGNSGMDFALNLDRIDLDRYQPPPTEETADSEPIELPVELLKPLRAKGIFEAGEIKVGGARLSQLSAAVSLADGVGRFGPLRAQLYGGTYSGDIGLDMRPEVPRLTMDEHMRGIDIAALMKDYVDSERLSGRGNLDMVLSARGRSGDALLATLTGRIGLDLQDGAVEGIDIWYAIEQAQSLIKNRQLSAAANTRRTAFDTFKANAELVDGVASTRDLVVASQLLRITGQGSTSLVSQELDFTVTATVLRAPPEADADIAELTRAAIPVRITGTLADPKIRPDLAGLVKDRVKQEIDERKEELRQEVEEKRQELEEKVRDKVRDRLNNLLNR